MRKLMLPALVAGLLLVLGTSVQAQDDVKKLVENAIKAHGGADKLDKAVASRMKSKGTVNLGGAELEFTLDSASQLPDKLKNVIQIDIMGQKIQMVQIYNSGKAWMNINGVVQDVREQSLDDMKAAVHAQRVNRLVPLLKDPEFKLSPLGEAKVAGKPAVGIKVEAKGHKEISLYFDKETGMIAKSERKVYDEMANQEVMQEELFSGYKDFDGVKLPTKLVINREGKKFLEGEVTELKIVDKIDDKEFAKPE